MIARQTRPSAMRSLRLMCSHDRYFGPDNMDRVYLLDNKYIRSTGIKSSGGLSEKYEITAAGRKASRVYEKENKS